MKKYTKFTQEELDEAIRLNDLYVSTDGKEGKRTFFSGCNPSGLDFKEANLKGANLKTANLEGAKEELEEMLNELYAESQGKKVKKLTL